MTPVVHAHPAIGRFATADGMLRIGGLPVGLLAQRANATPFFAYQRSALTQRVNGRLPRVPRSATLCRSVRPARTG